MIKIDIEKKLFGIDKNMQLKVNISIKEREFIAVHGKSGSGKTTLLRILAGLEKAKGKIIVDNIIWLNKQIDLPPQKREIGFVFQDYALFENMTIKQNLLFVKKDKELANYLLDITEMYPLKDRLPNKLSGGQKQRVALCRALMNRPKILLMDEPFSALDNEMKIKLQNEIILLHKEFNTTTIMVSHNIDEIDRLSSRVIEIDKGEIVSDSKEKLSKEIKAKILNIDNNIATIKIESNNLKTGDTILLKKETW